MGIKDMYLSTMLIVYLACASAAGGDKVAMSSPGVADWPPWAGPKGNCTTDEKGLLKAWPKEGPSVLWRIRVGTGSNHPSVAGDDLCFAQLDDDSLHETVKCLDANTGKEKWSHTYEVPPVYKVGWGELGVRATPIARGRLYIRTPVEIICYDIRDRSATGKTAK
jgi:outer membrane protein assembly factor BamB